MGENSPRIRKKTECCNRRACCSAGIDLKGKIAMVRYGGNFRGLKVKAAQDAGAAGVIIYSDPGDDGEGELHPRFLLPDHQWAEEVV